MLLRHTLCVFLTVGRWIYEPRGVSWWVTWQTPFDSTNSKNWIGCTGQRAGRGIEILFNCIVCLTSTKPSLYIVNVGRILLVSYGHSRETLNYKTYIHTCTLVPTPWFFWLLYSILYASISISGVRQ
jgi:hypothetical protein